MHTFFNNGLFVNPFCTNRSIGMFSFLLFFSFLNGIYGQDSGTYFKCPESIPVFTGVAEATLCEQYPNFSCEIQIGTGTQYPKSSDLNSNVLSGNVCVVGNFKVDGPFTFQNAVVKINTGVTISVAPSTDGSTAGFLSIDNSKLFACNGLWKGITLGFLSGISTFNNSQIEDAEKAIYGTGYCGLYIQQTTFNRNRVGIELNSPFPSVFAPGPQVWAFTGNKFTCDAPINGTVEEVTEAGVKLIDTYLYTFQSGSNTFEDIRFGIHSTGASSYIGLQNLFFNRIKNNGIHMENGNIKLKASRFINNYGNGIYIKNAYNVSISGGCVFNLDDDVLPPTGDHWYHGIEIDGLVAASKTDISGNYFNVDFSSIDYKSVELLIYGTVEGGSNLYISKNVFHSYGETNHGIQISTTFSDNTHTSIIDNDFDIKNVSEINEPNEAVPTGIIVNGNLNNLNIFDNTFFNTPPVENGYAWGVVLTGSEGIDNQVSNNHFDEQGSHLESYSIGVLVQYFKNTQFCANTFYNTANAFTFTGGNEGTDVSNNIVYGGQMVRLHALNTWVEDQPHKGNQWTLEFNGTTLQSLVTPQEVCDFSQFASLSQFQVHTQQSTQYNGTGFNPFHPRDIDPDTDDEWWSQTEGTPGDCVDWLAIAPGSDSRLKRTVADGSFANQFNDATTTWQAERALYFALMRNPSIESTYSAYPTFRTAKQTGNIGKLYEVAVAIDAARNGSATLIADAKNKRIDIDNQLTQIESADIAWQNASTESELATAKNNKQALLTNLSELLVDAKNLQTSYNNSVNNAIPSIKQINNSINPSNLLEGYEKTVNAIHLENIQNGSLTDAQVQALETIAEMCPQSGGMAVYKARSLLPACMGYNFNDYYNGCLPDLGTPEIVRSRSTKFGLQESNRITITPNPTTVNITLKVPPGRQGKMMLYNTLGNLVTEKKLLTPYTVVETTGIPSGIYSCYFIFDDGGRESHLIIINK